VRHYNILWTRYVNKKIKTNITSIIKTGLIIYIKDIEKDKIKKDIEIKKAYKVNIAETINIKKGYDKRNIIFAVK